jgi:glutamine amidotransferase
MIGIINFGMGNLRSVQKAFERIRINASIISNPADISHSDKLVLPGVGHFEQGMLNLKSSGFDKALQEAVLVKKTPILGICLGMQLLTRFSEEGNVNGLGFIKGEVKRFPQGKLKIPHMGWNSLNLLKDSALFPFLEPEEMVYFVHSYYVTCHEISDVLYQTNYGMNFDSAFEHENIIGFQFHPEKSHKTGLRLLERFSKI